MAADDPDEGDLECPALGRCGFGANLRLLTGGEAALVPDCPSPSTTVSSSGSQPPSVFVIQQDWSAGERGALCSSSWRSQSTPPLSGQSSFWEPRISGPAPPLSGFRRGLGTDALFRISSERQPTKTFFLFLGLPLPQMGDQKISVETAAQAACPLGDPVPASGKQRSGAASSAGLERGAHADVSCESRTWGPVPGGTGSATYCLFIWGPALL